MTPPAASSPSIPISAEHSSDKRRAALHSMLAAAAMTSLKLAAGILSGSLGVLLTRLTPGSTLRGQRSHFSPYVSQTSRRTKITPTATARSRIFRHSLKPA